jgi:ribosomal protein S18 acetylase RimI-like enzyme
MASFDSKPEKIYQNFAKNLGSNTRRAWIFKNETGEDVGKMHVRLETPQSGYIHDLGVLPAHRRKGYASAMVLAIIELLRKEGCHHIILDVLSHNESAIKLYEKCGFDITNKFNLWRLKTKDTLEKIIGL